MRTVLTLRSAAVALALATTGAGHGASAQQYTTLAYGGIKCADWTGVRSSKPAEAAVYEAWILGFISAYNAFIYKGPNVAAGTDFLTGFHDALRVGSLLLLFGAVVSVLAVRKIEHPHPAQQHAAVDVA